MRALAELMKRLLALVGILLCLVVLSPAIYHWLNSWSIKNFCEESAVDQSVDELNALIKENNFFVVKEIASDTKSVVIMNQRSPFFRMGCFIELENRKSVSAKYVAGD